ncbi:MAG: 50S ribosomal protein L13 [Oligosphaeraceae bacterium]|nr:50S ribosomal protein L13 [Oligosphaeraceae bacterium]
MKTYLPKVDEIERKWYIIDANGLVLGRLAVQIANMLRGKHKPIFTPHLDCGDYIVVVNADKVVLTGRKEELKEYQDYSGHIDGLKRYTAATVRAKNPTRLISDAVWGMMPKGRLGRAQFGKLKLFAGDGPEHKFVAQKAEVLVIK